MRKYNDVIDIYCAVKEFYGILSLEALQIANPQFEHFKHSHAKWAEDLEAYKNEYASHFSSAIYDYTVVVCAGEIRHAKKHAWISHPNFSSSTDRDEVYNECVVYKSQQIAEISEIIFGKEANWDSGYGGLKWAQIAHAATLRTKLNNISFIDHCVDLSHNNSVYFDKGAGIFKLTRDSRSYLNMLNTKRDEAPDVVLQSLKSKKLQKLLERAITLGITWNIPSASKDYYDTAIEAVLNYRPIEWGTLNLNKEDLVYKYGRNGKSNDRRRRDRDED